MLFSVHVGAVYARSTAVLHVLQGCILRAVLPIPTTWVRRAIVWVFMPYGVFVHARRESGVVFGVLIALLQTQKHVRSWRVETMAWSGLSVRVRTPSVYKAQA